MRTTSRATRTARGAEPDSICWRVNRDSPWTVTATCRYESLVGGLVLVSGTFFNCRCSSRFARSSFPPFGPRRRLFGAMECCRWAFGLALCRYSRRFYCHQHGRRFWIHDERMRRIVCTLIPWPIVRCDPVRDGWNERELAKSSDRTVWTADISLAA